MAVFFVLLLFLTSAQTSQCPPGLQSLGALYDVMKGNPQSSGDDPGWTHNFIVESNCPNGQVPPYIIIDNTNCDVCSYESKSSSITTIQSYQTQLHDYIKLGFGSDWLTLKGAFSASEDFQATVKGLEHNQYKYTQVTAFCETYCAQFAVMPPGTLTPASGFAYSVNQLPVEYDKQALYKFMSRYGTHYTTEITMGGRASQISTFSSQYWQQLESQGINMNIAAEADWAIYTVNGQIGGHYSQQLAQIFQDSYQDSQLTCSPGECPNFNHSSNNWLTSIEKNPVTVQCYMQTIGQALRQFNFTNGTIKAENLDRFLNESYCSMLKGCREVNSSTILNGTWSSIGAINNNCARYKAITSYYNNSLYSYSGCQTNESNSASSTLFIFDLVNNTQQCYPSYFDGVALDEAAGTILDHKLIIAGGLMQNGNSPNFKAYFLDLTNNQWFTLGSLNQQFPLLGSCSVQYQGNLVVLSEVKYDQQTQLYLTTINDQTITQMLVGQIDNPNAQYMTCALIDNDMYIIGGMIGSKEKPALTNLVLKLSLTDYSVSAVADILVPVYYASSFTINNMIYVTGGFIDMRGHVTNLMQIYNPVSDRWSYGNSMPVARAAHSTVVVDEDNVIVLGGSGSSNQKPVAEIHQVDF